MFVVQIGLKSREICYFALYLYNESRFVHVFLYRSNLRRVVRSARGRMAGEKRSRRESRRERNEVGEGKAKAEMMAEVKEEVEVAGEIKVEEEEGEGEGKAKEKVEGDGEEGQMWTRMGRWSLTPPR